MENPEPTSLAEPAAAEGPGRRGWPLRLLVLYDRIYPQYLGGVEHRNLELARRLAERGHRVTLAGFSDAAVEPFPGVEIRPGVPLRHRRQ